MPESAPRPVMLVILDGWGLRDEVADNAVHQAKTPIFDALMREHMNAIVEQHEALFDGPPAVARAGEARRSNEGHTR